MGVNRMGPLAALALAFGPVMAAQADEGIESYPRPGFERLSTLANYLNNDDLGADTVSEIVAASRDGRTLVYTDGAGEDVGVVDISNPHRPRPAGKIPVGGEPTSVAVLGNRWALVGVNSGDSFAEPAGHLAIVDLKKQRVGRSIDLGGQPDSLAISPNGRYVAVVIENERDEEICVGGSFNGAPVPEDGPEAPGDVSDDQCEDGGGAVGVLPQTGVGNPPGYLVVFDRWDDWKQTRVELTGLADYAPEDPEPEFVDINKDNLAVVSLQENNHLAIVDLKTGAVVNHFSAGTVDLDGIDATEDGRIDPSESLTGIPREPDAVAWVPGACGGEDGIGTANEGDLFGGSRGFSIFCQDGSVAYDSGNTVERLAMAHGHYPEDRSENKGSEPEAVEFGRYGKHPYLFVGSERGSFVAVYSTRGGKPEFQQLLHAPLGPEGVLAVPQRGLLVVSGEEDDPDYGVRSSMMIYGLRGRVDAYPQIVARDGIGWAALSGMVAVPGERNSVLAVWDSYYSESNVFRIDTSGKPAVITEALTLSGGNGNYDPEGIAVAPDGTWWIASEGQAPGGRPNLLVQTDTLGNVLQEVGLPEAIEACRAASAETGSLGSGFEGVAVLPGEAGAYKLLAAQQRPWYYTTAECLDLDDEAGFTRIWVYDPETGEWDHIAYELAPQPQLASWVGLSEITRGPRGDYVLIERDNRTGDFASLKTLVKVNVAAAADGVIHSSEKSVYDLLPDLYETNGWISDKAEGVSIDDRGRMYLVTDNDGVEDWSGETWFLDLGNYRALFRR